MCGMTVGHRDERPYTCAGCGDLMSRQTVEVEKHICCSAACRRRTLRVLGESRFRYVRHLILSQKEFGTADEEKTGEEDVYVGHKRNMKLSVMPATVVEAIAAAINANQMERYVFRGENGELETLEPD